MKTFDQLSLNEQDLAINFLVNDILADLAEGAEYQELKEYQDDIDELCNDITLSYDDLELIFYEWFDEDANFASLVSQSARARAIVAFYREDNDEVFDLNAVLSD